MNYKELQQIAKEVGAVVDVLMLGRHDNTVFTTGELERFAEALIAEIAKQNEPVAYRWKEKGRWLSWYVDWTWHDKAKSLGFPVEYAYTFPPTAEQIANETTWQLIETAPKDGQLFLAYSTEFANHYWVTDKYNGMTHWMPLPTPPKRSMEGV